MAKITNAILTIELNGDDITNIDRGHYAPIDNADLVMQLSESYKENEEEAEKLLRDNTELSLVVEKLQKKLLTKKKQNKHGKNKH